MASQPEQHARVGNPTLARSRRRIIATSQTRTFTWRTAWASENFPLRGQFLLSLALKPSVRDLNLLRFRRGDARAKTRALVANGHSSLPLRAAPNQSCHPKWLFPTVQFNNARVLPCHHSVTDEKRPLCVCRHSLDTATFNRYIEPFLGAGSVFFYLEPKRAIIGDTNPDLIAAYKGTKNDWRHLQQLLRAYQRKHSDLQCRKYS